MCEDKGCTAQQYNAPGVAQVSCPERDAWEVKCYRTQDVIHAVVYENARIA